MYFVLFDIRPMFELQNNVLVLFPVERDNVFFLSSNYYI